MDEREWQTFVTVVSEGNITKAAEKLFLSQPALSYRLRHMEEALGSPLLLRTNEGIALTPQGELFHDYCRRMMREKEALKQVMGTISGEIQGTLKIASSINFADYELPRLLGSFTEKYPKIHIQVKTGYSQQVNKMFNAGEVMVAIARGDHKQTPNSVCLAKEPYCLVYKREVTIDELAKLPLIQYRTDPSIANIVDTWCRENMPPETMAAMELDSMVTCRHFVREGLGWSILPYMGLGSCREQGIFAKPITDSEGKLILRNTYMFYNEMSTRLVAVKTFIDYVEEYYKEHPYAGNIFSSNAFGAEAE